MDNETIDFIKVEIPAGETQAQFPARRQTKQREFEMADVAQTTAVVSEWRCCSLKVEQAGIAHNNNNNNNNNNYYYYSNYDYDYNHDNNNNNNNNNNNDNNNNNNNT